MGPDGDSPMNLTNSPETWETRPRWSPDGNRIAFLCGREGLPADICIMNADGSNRLNLTDHPASDGWPSWSPDGSHIAFESDREGSKDIFVIRTDGTGLLRLTFTAAKDHRPAWRPMR